MIPPHMIPAFLLIGCCIIMMSSLLAAVSVSTNKDVKKALEEWQNEQNEQNEQNNDPSSSPTPSPSQPRFRYPIGTTVKCEENDPYGENEKHRYRVSSNQGKLRHYPDDDIAKSWDEENWEYEEYIEDCAGLSLGDPMPSRPTVGKSAKCGKNDLKNKNNNAVYRVNEDGTFGHYPNSTIAASWDSDWQNNTTIGDCEGIILSGDLQINTDPVDCKGNWGDWGDCSKPCDGGTRSRTWNTTVEPRNNGTPCPPSAQTESCNTGSCGSCKAKESFVNTVDNRYDQSSWSREDIRSDIQWHCDKMASESACKAGEVDGSHTTSAFGSGDSYTYMCEWDES